jgi:hypothetical protein
MHRLISTESLSAVEQVSFILVFIAIHIVIARARQLLLATVCCGCGQPLICWPLALQESHIAWAYDQEHLYGDNNHPYNFNIYPDLRGGNTSEVDLDQNQHLMVWLRPAAQPDFRKLYAVITVPLAAGVRSV